MSHGAPSVIWKPRLYRRWLDPMVRECGYLATQMLATPLTPAPWETSDREQRQRVHLAPDREGTRPLRSRRMKATHAGRRAQTAAKGESQHNSDRKLTDGPTARPDTNRLSRREATRHTQPRSRYLTHDWITPNGTGLRPEVAAPGRRLRPSRNGYLRFAGPDGWADTYLMSRPHGGQARQDSHRCKRHGHDQESPACPCDVTPKLHA